MSTQIPAELLKLSESIPEVPEALRRDVRAEAPRFRGIYRSARRRRRRIGGGLAVALVAFAFSPPGQAATGWLADLAGFGDQPSLRQIGTTEDSPVVLTSGKLESQLPYELVLKRITPRSRVEAISKDPGEQRELLDRGFGFSGVCLQVDWPEFQLAGQGGMCTAPRDAHVGVTDEETTIFGAPSASGLQSGLLAGFSVDGRIASIEAVQTEPSHRKLPTETIRVEGAARERLGVDYPSVAFVTQLDDELIARGRRNRAQVVVTAYDASGESINSVRAFRPPFICDEQGTPLPSAGSDETKPAGRQGIEIRPATREDILASRRCLGPQELAFMELRYPVLDLPVTPEIRRAADAAGFVLEPTVVGADFYAELLAPDSELSSPDSAGDAVAGRAAAAIDGSPEPATLLTDTRTYLARLRPSGQLVYVVRHIVKAVKGPAGPAKLDPQRRFLGIFDVRSGEEIVVFEIAPG